jgi:hypothetical protein
MPLTLGLIGAGTSVLGGGLGYLFGGDDRDKADKLMAKVQSEIDAIGAPPDVAKALILQRFQQAGMYTPQLEQAIEAGPSKVAGIKENAELGKAQMGALQLLQQRGSTGLSPEDRAALNQVRGEVQRDSNAKTQSILQQMQARGMGGSGAELIAQLQAGQSGDDRASAEGDRLAAQASQNALQALTQSGQLAGNIRGQDFDINKQRAAAEDEINRFNTQNAISRQTRNVGSTNQASQYNLSNAQQISNANTEAANAELQRQRAAQMQVYQAKLDAAKAKAGAAQTGANYAQGQAAATQQSISGAASGINAGLNALAKPMAAKTGRTTTSSTGQNAGAETGANGGTANASGTQADDNDWANWAQSPGSR